MFSKGVKTIAKEEVLSVYTEEQILHKYFPEVKTLPQKICSPFRKDEHPSLGLSLWQGHIIWKDFATGDKGNLWTLLSGVMNIPLSKVYERVFSDMCGKDFKGFKLKKPAGITFSNANCDLGTVRRKWSKDDFEYWSSYGITKDFLKKSGTFPISYILLRYDGFTSVIKADKFAYVYIEKKDGEITQKIYQPFNQRGWKWRSSSNASVWNLWTLLPETGEKLVITSSKKDAMCIWCNTGIPSVCPQSEGTDLKPQVVEELKKRFAKIYVFYDNDFGRDDNPGRRLGKKLAKQFGFIQIEIPETYEAKDPSDFYKKYGKEKFTEILNDLTH